MDIVIAEDEAIIRMDVRELLEEQGHRVVGEARSGIEALPLARALQPDCIFIDIHMDGLDGLDAARVICAEHIAPVVMLTAYSQQQFIEEASELGVMAYVSKPFTESDILSALQIATSRFAEVQALVQEVEDLQGRLEARRDIERAKGILMKRGLDEAAAFSRLQKMSMDSRRPLKEVAQAVILTAEVL
jgi:two-component system, response regulator PdtaR